MLMKTLMFQSFDECEQIMLQRGRIFLDTLLEARGKVAKQALPFISDGCVCNNIFFYSSMKILYSLNFSIHGFIVLTVSFSFRKS